MTQLFTVVTGMEGDPLVDAIEIQAHSVPAAKEIARRFWKQRSTLDPADVFVTELYRRCALSSRDGQKIARLTGRHGDKPKWKNESSTQP